MPLLRQPARGLLLAGCFLLALTALSQTSKLPSIVVTDAGDGVRIGLSAGTLPPARVLRLSGPDRLVLDFDGAALDIATTEVERWRSRGVRMAFHPETLSTRVVFDIPGGQQQWMKTEGNALVVRFTSASSKNLAASSTAPPTSARTGQPATAPVQAQAPTHPAMRTATPATTGPTSRQDLAASRNSAPRQTVAALTSPSVLQNRLAPASRPAAQPAAQEPPETQTIPETHLKVISYNGLLQVSAKGVAFKSILDEIATATGATVQTMTPIGGTEEIFEWGPAPPLEVIKKLFEGSPYNYLVISEPNSDSRISRILVTSTVRLLPGNDGPISDDDTNPEDLAGIAPLQPPKPH